MDNCIALDGIQPSVLMPPSTDLSPFPAKLTKRLWVSPTQFLVTTHAQVMAEWALAMRGRIGRCLPSPSRRGPKSVYRDSSVMVTALIQVAWQLGYEDTVDYLRAHPEAARAAGFPEGRVISVGQYWERRHALGSLPFWFFFIGMVWQLVRLGVIWGTDVILDATTQPAWFHDDAEAGWSFPRPWKGSVWG